MIRTQAAVAAPEAVRVIREASSEGLQDWRFRLITSSKGVPKPILANCLVALRHAPECVGMVAYDEFAAKIAIRKTTPWGARTDEQWTDHHDRKLAEWLQQKGILVGVELAGQAIQTVAEENRFHPLREWLDSLQWDGVERIGTVARDYLGAEDSNYTRAVFQRWLISGPARVYQPGIKADSMVTLEGSQGSFKSTFLRVLGGPYFTDDLADLGSKDAALQLMGAWIIELSELDSMSRSEVGTVKAFMSRQTDRFRPPYGKRVVEMRRQCVFAGTVNHNQYLKDDTGGRRFWPIECTRIDVKATERDRDQIWAEAVHAYKSGAPWWLDSSELIAAAAVEQSHRYNGDPWETAIEEWLTGRTEVTIAQVLQHAIGKSFDKMPQSDQNRVSACLRSLKWRNVRSREGEDRKRVWRRPDEVRV